MTGSNVAAPVNPYFYGGPVKDPDDFFGRGEQLQTICERLQKAQSTSLIGQRCSGKTSLLYYLMTHVAQAAHFYDAGSFVFFLLDSQLAIRNPSDFFRELMGALSEQVPSTALSPGDEVNERVVRAGLKKLAPRRLVILLDEFESILEAGSFPADFFRFLRGLAGRYDVCYITATMETLYECSPPEMVSSPFPNIFAQVHIGSFTQSEFEHFLAETSARSGAPILAHKDEISSLAGRFPFYVQMACSFYFDVWRERGRITPQDKLNIARRFADEVSPHLERMWQRYLTPGEKAALLSLAQGRQPSNDPPLHGLTYKGYVVDGRIFSSVLADFVLRKQAEGEQPLSDVLAVPPGPAARGVWVDREAGDVWVDGELIPPLTNLEYKLLICLYANANRICDRYEIVRGVWAADYINQVDDSRIGKLVSRLRRRVEPNPDTPRYIVTVHGRGYKLVSGDMSEVTTGREA